MLPSIYNFDKGLTEEEKCKQLTDVILMRLAYRLRTQNIYPLTKALVESIKFLEDVQADFADLKQAHHAYLVMVEWRKRVCNERGDTSAGRMVTILQDAKIDNHLVCLVCIMFFPILILPPILCRLAKIPIAVYLKQIRESTEGYLR